MPDAAVMPEYFTLYYVTTAVYVLVESSLVLSGIGVCHPPGVLELWGHFSGHSGQTHQRGPINQGGPGHLTVGCGLWR